MTSNDELIAYNADAEPTLSHSQIVRVGGASAEMIAAAREFLATPNLGKSLMRELDKAMIHLRELADALEVAESRITGLEAEAKEYRIDRIHRIGELQELAEAEARIAELEAGEWEYGRMYFDEAGLPRIRKTTDVTSPDGHRADGSPYWNYQPMRRRKAGPWVPVESEVE